MNERPLSSAEIDDEARFLRPLLRRPPWISFRSGNREEREDTTIRTLFKRYRPGRAPHNVSLEMQAMVWQHDAIKTEFIPEALKADETALIRAVQHAALVLHLLARGPVASPNGLDFGRGCREGGLSDERFARLMGTPKANRLEAISRVMQRLERAGKPLHWLAEDREKYSTHWNARRTDTDEVWSMLNFLFGYNPNRSITRWAAGFFRVEDAGETATDTAETA